jgi:hypothetical protein
MIKSSVVVAVYYLFHRLDFMYDDSGHFNSQWFVRGLWREPLTVEMP